jgi:hypothetical protein
MAVLSNEQIVPLANRMKEKQPHLQLYFLSFIGEICNAKELAVHEIIFIYIIRAYEYEYDEIAEIPEEKTDELNERIIKFFQTELKRNSINKVYKEIRKNARQKELIDFLESLSDGKRFIETPFRNEIKPHVMAAIYSIILLLNETIEAMNQEL